MELQYVHLTEGQEVSQEDLNLLGENAALADDRVIAELMRVTPYSSGVAKGIIRWGVEATIGAATSTYPLVAYNGGVLSVAVCPFRAVVGSRATGTDKAWLRDIRSAVFVGAGAAAPLHTVLLSATSANHRWDTIYARVDVDVPQAVVNRYVKAADGAVSLESVTARQMTQVTIGVTMGAESATPVRAAPPADGGGSYYIVLAYVLVEHPSAGGVIPAYRIHEVAPILQLSGHAGGAPLAPCNAHHTVSGFAGAAWTAADGKPRSYLPPTLAGSVQRVLALMWGPTDDDVPLDAYTIVDTSIDWRDRLVKTEFQVFPNTDGFGWSSALGPRPVDGFVQMGQTCRGDTYGGNLPADSRVLADVQSGHGLDSGARLLLFVNSSGALLIHVSATSPARGIVFWLTATGTYPNHGVAP